MTTPTPAERIAELEGQIVGLLEKLGYFSCPECRCCWFGMYGNHADDSLQCTNCGWHGPRKDGESERFFRKAQEAAK